MNSQGQHPEKKAYRARLDAIISASKKFLRVQETFDMVPNMRGFARLIDAALELHHAIDPEEKESLGTQIVYRLLRLVLTFIGDITRHWKKWNRVLKRIRLR